VPRARIADIAIGAKVRVSKNVIAKNGIEPLKRAIAPREKRGSGGRVFIACRRPGPLQLPGRRLQPVGRIADEVAAEFFPTDPPQEERQPPGSGRARIA
jgi:hypothetical protein